MIIFSIPQEGEESNPLRFHANLDDLDSSSDTAESQDEKASKSGVYVPPKIAAVPYTDKGRENTIAVISRLGA